MLLDLLVNSASATPILALGLPFLLWRVWAFTLKSWMQPTKVKELPYWVPVFGHVYDFFWNSVELMESGINYLGRSHELFSIQLPGKKLYIVTRPEDVTSVFNNQHGIDNDYSLREVLLAFGVTKDDLARAWHVPKPGDFNYIENDTLNPQHMCFIKWVQDGYRKHLLTPKTLNKMATVFRDSLLDTIQTDSITYCMAGEDNHYSLYTIIRNVMVEASAQTMFGSHLHEIDPNIIEHMLNFNDFAWQAVMRYPDFFGRLEVSQPQKKMMAIMKQFVQSPKEKTRQANTFIQNVLAGMDVADLGIHSRAAMMLMIFWAAVSNEYNGTFWLISHLLYDESLLEKVREETEAAWHDGELDMKHLSESCPVLDAAFNEVLRHKNGAGAMRLVAQKTDVGGKELQPGNMAYIPFHQLHTNEDVWGERRLEFDHTRFLKKKSLARNTSFRPFGGGATYCPGRTLAKREVFSAVAIFLHRFNMKLAVTGKEKQPFPVLNIKTPSLGVNGPVKDMDVIVEMTERSHN